MNRLPFLILALILSTSYFVQTQVPTQRAPTKREFKYAGKIESTYDKSKDETMLFFKLTRIKAGEHLEWEGTNVTSDERLDFSMYFTYPGQRLTTPKWVGIGIASGMYEPKQYGDYDLTIVGDKQTFSIGKMTVHDRGATRYDPRRPPVRFQLLEAAIPYDQFLQIANARKVKLRIGHKEFPLDNENLEAVRDLASHTVP
jgi:hypothetical protein